MGTLGDKIRVLANGVIRTTASIPIKLCKRVLRIRDTGKERIVQCLFDRDWQGASISGHSGGVDYVLPPYLAQAFPSSGDVATGGASSASSVPNSRGE